MNSSIIIADNADKNNCDNAYDNHRHHNINYDYDKNSDIYNVVLLLLEMAESNKMVIIIIAMIITKQH